jgi:hypothetical protein
MFGGALNKHRIVLKRENQLSAPIGVELLLRQ